MGGVGRGGRVDGWEGWESRRVGGGWKEAFCDCINQLEANDGKFSESCANNGMFSDTCPKMTSPVPEQSPLITSHPVMSILGSK